MLLITAFANGWAEEVIVVAFLLTRLRQLRVNPVAAVLASSLLRGAYHLYQGFSAGLGNVVMGLVFAYVWRRTGRLWPLIIAHGIIDSVAYVGYALAAGHLGWLRDASRDVDSCCERQPAAGPGSRPQGAPGAVRK